MTADTKRDHQRMALVVDDEPSILSILGGVLEQDGFTVEVAQSGEEAIASFRADYYSVVITDVCMGEISGFDLIEKLSQLDPALKAVVMTGHDSYEMVKNSLRRGAYDYLPKPLDDHDAIKLCVQRAAQASELIRYNQDLVAQLQVSHDLLEQVNKRYRLLNEELRIQANTDSLTEIYNRRFIDHALLHEVNRRNRYPDPLSIVMIDIDNFKAFNDTYGHEGGDTVLKAVAEAIKDCARVIDVVGRYGGEEFFVILPKTSPENAMVFAERVRKFVSLKTIALNEQQCQVTVSAGVAGFEKHEESADISHLVNAADRALYEAKGAGRNCCREGVPGKESFGAEKRT